MKKTNTYNGGKHLFLLAVFICTQFFTLLAQTDETISTFGQTGSLIGPDHTFSGMVVKTKAGRLIHIFRIDPGDFGNHVGNNGAIAKRYSDDDGKTWSFSEIIYKDGYDDRVSSGGVLDNGDIIVFFGRYAASSAWSGSYVDFGFISSKDGGQTWSNMVTIPSTAPFSMPYNIFKIPTKSGYFCASYFSYYADIRYSPDGYNWDSVYSKWDYRTSFELNIAEPTFSYVGDGKMIGLFRVANMPLHQTVSYDYGKTWSYPVPTTIANGYFCSLPLNFYDESTKKLFTIACDRRGSDYDMNNYNSGLWIYCNNPNDLIDDPGGYQAHQFVPRGNPNIFRFLGYPVSTKLNDSTYIVLYSDTYKKPNNYEDADIYQFYIHLGIDMYLNRENQNISFENIPPLKYGEPMYKPMISTSSKLPVTLHSTDINVAQIENGNIKIVGVGTCSIIAEQAGNKEFKPASPVYKQVFIDKANQSINLKLPPNVTINQPDIILEPKAVQSNIDIKYVSSDTNIAQIFNNHIKILSSGSCVISAELPGNDLFYPAQPISQVLTVNKLNQTIDFKLPPSVLVNSQDINLTPFSSANLPIIYSSSDTSIADIDGSILKIKKTGNCLITAEQPGNETYNQAFSITKSIIVNKLNQSINFQIPASVFVNSNDIQLPAFASSKLPITYESSDTTIAAFSGTIITIKGSGICTITATQSGNEMYNEALTVTHALSVMKLDQYISIQIPTDVYINNPDIELPEKTSGGLPITYSSSDTNIAIISKNTIHITGAGICSIFAEQAGNEMYNPAQSSNKVLHVLKLNQSISFYLPQMVYVGSDDIVLQQTASSKLPIQYESSDTNIAKIVDGSVKIVGYGMCLISANQTGNEIFNPALSVSKPLFVDKLSQVIAFNNLPQLFVNDSLYKIQASASSKLAITYTTSDTSIAEIKDGTIIIKSAGSCTITAEQDGNYQYFKATPVFKTLIINKKEQFITFDKIEQTQYNEKTVSIKVSSSSSLPVELTSTDTTIVKIVNNNIEIVNIGACYIIANQGGNKFYHPAQTVIQKCEIIKADQTIAFEELNVKTFGDPDFTLQSTASSDLKVYFTSSDTNIAVVNETNVHIKNAGECFITANQDGNSFYNKAQSISKKLIILKADQSIEIDSISTHTFGDKPFKVKAIASSGLPIKYSSTDTNIVKVDSDATIEIIGAGDCSLISSQEGDSNYNAANSVSKIIKIEKAQQKITFSKIPHFHRADSTIELHAFSNAGLDIEFTSSNNKIAIINGHKVKITGIGTCIIYAHQKGNNNYYAAESVSQLFIVLDDTTKSQIETQERMNVYPIPSTGIITISNVENQSITIFDNLGKVIFRDETTNSTRTIDLSQYQSGIYVIKAKDRFNNTKQKRFMIIK